MALQMAAFIKISSFEEGQVIWAKGSNSNWIRDIRARSHRDTMFYIEHIYQIPKEQKTKQACSH